MKGVQTVASELSPEISPTWELERDAIEWGFLKQVRYVAGAGVQPAQAAAVSTIRLRNPPGSGVLGVIDFAGFSVPVNNSTLTILFSSAVAQAALGTAIVTGTQDGRWGFIEAVLGMSRANVGGAGSFFIANRILLTNQYETFESQVVLPPNTSIDFTVTSVNVALTLNLNWHERAITPLEL